MSAYSSMLAAPHGWTLQLSLRLDCKWLQRFMQAGLQNSICLQSLSYQRCICPPSYCLCSAGKWLAAVDHITLPCNLWRI